MQVVLKAKLLDYSFRTESQNKNKILLLFDPLLYMSNLFISTKPGTQDTDIVPAG